MINLNIKSPHAETRMGTTFVMAGAERIELSTHGFGGLSKNAYK